MSEAKLEVTWQLLGCLAGVFLLGAGGGGLCFCLGNCFGFFYHNISLHYSEMKDNV